MNKAGPPWWGPYGIFAAVLAAQLGTLRPDVLQPQLAQLGWEYGHVAESLLQGHGFANPFGYETGPTAWMPPGVVMVYALTFMVFGAKTYAAACALLVGKALALALTAALLGRCTLAWGGRHPSLFWLFLLSGTAFALRWDWLTGLELDESFTIVLSASVLLCLAQLQQKIRFWHGLLAAVLPLCSPPLALGFGSVLLCRLLFSSQRKALLSLILVAFLSTLGWTVRNGVVFERVIPSKSNLWFEFYLSNIASPSGLLSTETLVRCHPIHEKNSAEIKNLGESAMCERYRRRGLDWLEEHGVDFGVRVAARARSVFLYGYTTDYFQWSGLPLRPTDTARLKVANLLWVDEHNPARQYWLFPDFDEVTAQALLGELPLKDPQAALRSWKGQVDDRQAFVRRPGKVVQALLFSLGPTLVMVLGLCWGYLRWQPFREAILLYLVYFLPYVLVSYTQRYQISALGLTIWLTWLLIISVSQGLSTPRERQHSSDCRQ